MGKFTKENIITDPLFKNFIRSRNIKDKTIRLHEARFTMYCNYIKKSPTELIEEAEEDESAGIRMRSRKINEYFFDYREYLASKNLSPRTIIGYMASVKAFYSEYDIVLPKDVKNNKFDENPAFQKLPTVQDIRKVLDIASTRDKSIILLHLSSAMGAAELRSLRYSSFIDAVSDEVDINDSMNIEEVTSKVLGKEDIIGKWDLQRIKTGMYYTTYSSPESIHAIAKYLLDRLATNKPIPTIDSPLFTNHSNDELGETAHFLIFERLNDRAGLGYRTKKRRFFTSHQLRKFFASEFTKAHVDNNAIEMLSGRKIAGVRSAYIKLDKDWLREEYLKGLKVVSIENVEVRRMETEDIKMLKELQNQVKSSQEQIKSLQDQLDRKERLDNYPQP